MTAAFGTLVGQLRRSLVVTVAWPYLRNGGDGTIAATTGPMSQSELARRANVDPALVHRIERGLIHPSFRTLVALADALELDGLARAGFYAAAGYWPWPELDDAQRLRVVSTALAVVEGDERRLEASDA